LKYEREGKEKEGQMRQQAGTVGSRQQTADSRQQTNETAGSRQRERRKEEQRYSNIHL
jgi:hypothetical protein